MNNLALRGSRDNVAAVCRLLDRRSPPNYPSLKVTVGRLPDEVSLPIGLDQIDAWRLARQPCGIASNYVPTVGNLLDRIAFVKIVPAESSLPRSGSQRVQDVSREFYCQLRPEDSAAFSE